MTEVVNKTGFWKKLRMMLEAMSASDYTADTYVFERLRAQDTRIKKLETRL